MPLLSDDDLEESSWYSDPADDDAAAAPPQPDLVTDPEVWCDYHSEFLVTLYHTLQDQVAGLGVPILDACTFHDFATFGHRFSSGRKPAC